MANRIKGITVEIGGDTTKLQTALKGVNGQIKNTQSALKDVERLLKLDPTNTNLLAQKQKLLTQAIGETKEKLTTLKTAAQQANEQLQKGEISQEQYDALQREIAATEAELKRLESQASKTNQTLTKIGEVGGKLENAGDSIANAGKKVSVASAAVTAMGGAAVKTAADFESSMSQVQATMGITKNSMSKVNGQSVNTMDTLSDLAKTMGAKTAYSASECAEALNYLALAGYDTQEMCDTLPTVLNLAAAGNIDLASASDMVTDAMSALGLKTKDADKMVDQMAKTASSTNTSVGQLGEGILTIGATAKSVKGGTAELNTALGILANNGIKGAEGGTHLRNVILSLQNPTDGAAKTMEKLGVQTYDSEGNMRSLNDILGDLNKSMDGMTSAEKANIIATIFNKTDLASVNALLANTGDTWTDLQTAIENSGGAAQQMADTQLDNLKGQLTILKSAVEGFAISIGETLMPMVKNIVSKIQSFVDWLNNLDEGTRQVIVKVGLFVAALGPFLVILGTVISKVGVTMQAFSKLGLKITRGVAFGQKATLADTLDCNFNAVFRKKLSCVLDDGTVLEVRDMMEQIQNNLVNMLCPKGKLPALLLDLLYPIGSIYMSTSSANPTNIMGGIWVSWGEGRVPVGVGTGTDSNNTSVDFSAANQTGGEYTHLLTGAESGQKAVQTGNQSASHTHSLTYNADSGAAASGSDPSGRGAFVRRTASGGATSTWKTGNQSAAHTHSISASNASNRHNNIQPYVTCYMWKRTA